MAERISWDEYFMKLASVASERATCFKGKRVGAILVKDKQVISTGYNGAPKGLENCLERGYCIRQRNNLPSGEKLEYCRAAHAEQNAVVQAASFGIGTSGSTLYTTHFPCVICAKILINAGIKEIVYAADQIDKLSGNLLSESNMLVRKIKNQ